MSFLAVATFELEFEVRSVDLFRDETKLRYSLILLQNIWEVVDEKAKWFATYDETVQTLTVTLSHWALIAANNPPLRKQCHTLRFGSREEIDQLLASMKAVH